MKEENYLEGIYGCLERIEKKVETLPVEGTSPAVGNRTSSPEGIAELKIRLERLQSAVEKNGLEIAAVRNHTVRLSEGWPLSAETFAGEMEKIRYCLSQDCQAVKETVRRLDERMVLLKKEPERRLVTYRLESASKAVKWRPTRTVWRTGCSGRHRKSGSNWTIPIQNDCTMATIRTKFRSSSAEGREGALYYQVIHNRVVRQISTGYKLFASEWDQRSEAVIPCQHPAGMERDNYLLSVGERIRRDKIRLEKAIRTLSQSGPFTADDIVIRFHDSGQEPSFNDYIRQQIVRLKRLGKIRTSETYTAALKSFSSFMKGSDILFGELSSDLLMEYEAYLKNRGNSPNTISFYMRILKAVYNRAVENGLTGQRNLFKSVYTGVEKTLKRAIHLNDIRRIKRLDLSLKPHLDFARDMFLFCFYTRGMSFVDMAYLKKGDIANGILTYRRKKTGQQLFIRWEKCMQEIIKLFCLSVQDFKVVH